MKKSIETLVELEFAVTLDKRLERQLRESLHPKSWARRPTPKKLKVMATSGAMRIEMDTGITGIFDLKQRIAAVEETESGRLAVFELNELSASRSRSRAPSVHSTGIVKEIAIADSKTKCEAFFVDFNGRRGTFWVAAQSDLPKRALRLLWNLILPDSDERPAGLPVVLHVSDEIHEDSDGLRMKLVSFRNSTADGFTRQCAVALAKAKGTLGRKRPRSFDFQAKLKRPPIPPGHSHGGDGAAPHQPLEPLEPVPGPGAGLVAWIANQSFLDQVRAIGNTITQCFSSFETEYDSSSQAPLNLLVDWWQQIQPRLNANNFRYVEWIRRAYLYMKVSQADDLVTANERPGGLMPNEEASYARIRDAIDRAYRTGSNTWVVPTITDPPPPWVTVLGGEHVENPQIKACLENPLVGGDKGLCRYLMTAPHSSIADLFTGFSRTYAVVGENDDRIEDLESAQLWADLGRPQRIDFPIGQHELVSVDGGLLISLGGISLSISIDNRELIDELVFENGRIRASLIIPEATVSLTVNPRPRRDVGDTILDILTLGLFGNMVRATNVRVSATTTEARLSFLITPTLDNGTLRFDVDFDPDDSQSRIPISTNLFGPVDQNVLDFLVGWFDDQATTFMDFIAGGIAQALDPTRFPWPDIWRARSAPDLRPLQPDLDTGVLWANLVRETIPGGGAPGSELDGSSAGTLGYALSARYLAAWLNRLLVPFPSVEPQIDWEGEFGIEMPDLASFATLPPDETNDESFTDHVFDGAIPDSCRPPEVDPPTRRFRTRATNYAPFVDFEGGNTDGTRDDAGRFVFTCDVRLDAVEDRGYARFVGLEPPRCFDLRGMPGLPSGPLQRDQAFRLAKTIAHMDFGPSALNVRQIERHLAGEDLGRARIGPRNGRLSMVPFEDLQGFTPGISEPGGIPGIPDVPGMPGLPDPGIPIPDGFSLIFCEEPRCEWATGTESVILDTLLRARIEVSGRLLLGFSSNEWIDLFGGQQGLPELMLGLERVSSGAPDLTANVIRLETSGPFESLDRDELAQQLTERCLNLAAYRLGSDGLDGEPDGVKFLVPYAALVGLTPIPADLLRIVVLKQKGAPTVTNFSTNDLTYKTQNDYLIWETELAETLSDMLA